MAKRSKERDVEHTSYCAGKGFIGDGNKNTSPCPFRDSRIIVAKRYVCYHCSSGTKPSDIIADANGITELGKQLMDAPADETPKRHRSRRGKEDLPELESKMIDGQSIDDKDDKKEIKIDEEAGEQTATEVQTEEQTQTEAVVTAEVTEDSANENNDEKPKKGPKKAIKKKRRLGRRRMPSGAE